MKRNISHILLSLMVLVLCVSCVPTTTDNPSSEPPASPPASLAPETTPEADPETEPEPEPEPEDTSFAAGETTTLGDWEITLNSFEVSAEIAASYGSFNAGDGNQYVVADLTVKNSGTSADTFLKSYTFGNSDVVAKIMYQGQYEFSASNLLGHSDDLHDKSLNPLSSKTGIIAFSVVDEAATSGELSLVLSLGKDNVTYNLK